MEKEKSESKNRRWNSHFSQTIAVVNVWLDSECWDSIIKVGIVNSNKTLCPFPLSFSKDLLPLIHFLKDSNFLTRIWQNYPLLKK